MNKIFFDTETTGLPLPRTSPLIKQPRIIEFGGIKTDEDGNYIDQLEFFANPGEPLDTFITKLTGINDAMLKHESPFVYYAEHLWEWLDGCELVAWNCPFDKTLLEIEFQRLDMPMPDVSYRDLMTDCFYVFGVNAKLADVHQHLLGKKITGAHRALNDVSAMLAVYRSRL